MKSSNKHTRYNDMESRAMRLGLSADEVSQLVRIDSTLSTWGEHECNGVIERDEDTGKCYWVSHQAVDSDRFNIRHRSPTPDRETGALKRAKAIAAEHDLGFYYQSDPRGVQVHLYRFADLQGRDIDSCYSQVSVAIYRPS